MQRRVDNKPINHLFVCIQDERLTVTQDSAASGNTSLLHFHYQLTERRSASWDTALSGDSLFLEIPAGVLVEGSKEGWGACYKKKKNLEKMSTYVDPSFEWPVCGNWKQPKWSKCWIN